MQHSPTTDQLLAALQQIERLSREADPRLVNVPAMLGDIARKAIASGPWKVQSSPHYPDRFEAVNADNLHLVTGFNTRAEAQIFCDTRNARETA